MRYEVDLRSRKTGDTIDSLLITNYHDKAYREAKEYNENTIEDFNENLPIDNYIDGNDGLFADVYEVEE